jgi:CHAT domain-containing protein
MRSFRPNSATVLCLALLTGGTAGLWEGLGRIDLSTAGVREEPLPVVSLQRMSSIQTEETISLWMELNALRPGQRYDAEAFEALERARSNGLPDLPKGTAERGESMHPPTLRETQELLDGETILLSYFLGKERSFLWKVTSDSLASFELPPRQSVEKEALRAYYVLSNSQRREARGSTSRATSLLSQMLLGQVASSLAEGKRLIIITDAPLQGIPFAALPNPANLAEEPLITSYEIVSAPSVSTLMTLRKRESRPEPPGLIALLGDPVFSARDERISRAALPEEDHGGNLVRAKKVLDLTLRRLQGSRQEVESIARLASAGPTLSALGFAASRELAASGRLSEYRYVHFATHGFLDPQDPDLSGLVLSGVDSRGRKLDGILRAGEIRIYRPIWSSSARVAPR